MATLANKSIKATLPSVVKYNNNPDKNLPPDGLVAAAAYDNVIFFMYLCFYCFLNKHSIPLYLNKKSYCRSFCTSIVEDRVYFTRVTSTFSVSPTTGRMG